MESRIPTDGAAVLAEALEAAGAPYSFIDEVATVSAEQFEAAARRSRSRYTFDDVTLTIGDEEIPLSNVSLSEPELEIRSPRDFPYHWSGTANFTTTMPKPAKPWEESPERAMARLLCSPSLLPEGPQRKAEERRARRRARNREAVFSGGMVPEGNWPWRLPILDDPAFWPVLPRVGYL